jgi:hypothetical protein
MGPAIAIVSGDCVAAARHCDILIHEVYSKQGAQFDGEIIYGNDLDVIRN